MALTYAQYINKNLRKLANYINHLADFSKKYNEGVKKLYSKSKADNITKSEKTIEYEKDAIKLTNWNDSRVAFDKDF